MRYIQSMDHMPAATLQVSVLRKAPMPDMYSSPEARP